MQAELDNIVQRIFYVMWTAIELTTIILCANLPAMYSIVHNAVGPPKRSSGCPRSTPSSGSRFLRSVFSSRNRSQLNVKQDVSVGAVEDEKLARAVV